MVQLVCPLCGRFVSLDYFNPESFDSDIFGVVTRGLGRGKGTMVVDRFSVLYVPEIVTPIKNRCLHLIGIIDGKSTPSQEDLVGLHGEVARWKKRALGMQKEGNDLHAKIADMESSLQYWQGEAGRLKMLNSDFVARIADDESIVKSWMNHSDKLSDEVSRHRSEEERLKRKIKSMVEAEETAIEEMESLLEYINEQTNETFESLDEGVAFLLELG